MNLKPDVLIVGAGPAGTAAAATLARAGRDVLVVDRAAFPRDKCCGDGLTTLALRELNALGLDPATVPSWTPVNQATIRSPRGAEPVFPLPSDAGLYAVIARRIELDDALVALAREAGATVADGHRLLGATETSSSIVADIEGLGEVVAPVAIGADGMWSPLRKALGMQVDGYRGEWHAFRQYFTNAGERASNELIVWFEPDLLPGYAWSFPLADGVINVGYGILRGGRQQVGDMKALWADILQRPHIRDFIGAEARPESSPKAWPIPARIDAVELASHRALFVGDAAAATDPLTGEGIGQALLTGRLAAEAIVADIETAGATYSQAARKELVADHHMAATLAKILKSPRRAEAVIRMSAMTEWTRRNFGRWLFEDYPRAVLLTPRRWHRSMFTSDGAYL